jgi:hypothetical protein
MNYYKLRESFSDMGEVEQNFEFVPVNTRATKPDESRSKSLYFLLLAIGRQRALSQPESRDLYREALSSLTVEKVEDSWLLSVSSSKGSFSKLVPRSQFKFYSTGLEGTTDSVVRRNHEGASEIWEFFEEILGITPKINFRRSFFSNRKFRNFKVVTVSQLSQILLIYSLFLPGYLKYLMFFMMAYLPITRLFWHSKHRTLALSIYLVLVGLGMFFEPEIVLKQEEFTSTILVCLVLLIAWSHATKVWEKNLKNRPKRIFALLCVQSGYLFVLLPKIQIKYVALTYMIVCLSFVLRMLRKKYIESTKVSIISASVEILFGASVGAFFVFSSIDKSTLISAQNIWMFLLIFILWIVYSFIFDSFVLTYRTFYPALLPLALSTAEFDASFILLTSASVIFTICFINLDKHRQN